ncbi:uncharacterized protein [Musca autumnalis]|uniref:uncharacterized protein n=1 Tax=Musca autumnalis TaxID=221902 RepID=UPI003CF2BD85
MASALAEGSGGTKILQEIALTEGGVRDRSEKENFDEAKEKRQERFLKELEKDEDESERKLKSTSLKRFFRISPKKSSLSPEEDLRSKSMGFIENKIERGNDNQVDEDDDEDTEEDEEEEAAGGSGGGKRDQYKRFKLRLGGMQRHSSNRDSESKIDLNSNASKITLKSSLSNYWNAVFKKKKSQSVNDMELAMEEVRTTNFMETGTGDQARTLTEDIHALKISEDPNEN